MGLTAFEVANRRAFASASEKGPLSQIRDSSAARMSDRMEESLKSDAQRSSVDVETLISGSLGIEGEVARSIRCEART